MSALMKPTDRLLDSVLDFLAHAPKAELQSYIHESGQDAAKLAQASKTGIASALKARGEKRRASLKAQQVASVADIQKAHIVLPGTMPEKFELFASLLQSLGLSGKMPSLQHRNHTELTEKELDQLLVQLIELSRPEE